MTHDLAYADPAIAAKQRATVDSQLQAMREGNPPAVFKVAGEFLKLIRRQHPATVTLLDAGCGSAYYIDVINFYTPNWVVYTGVDYNPGMVALAKHLYPKARVSRADLCALKFPPRSFDIVFSGACIAHIKNWPKALSNLIRTTKKYLILHRNPIWTDNSRTVRNTRCDYDTTIWVHRFNEKHLLSYVPFTLIAAKDLCPKRGNEVTRSYLFRKTRKRRTR